MKPRMVGLAICALLLTAGVQVIGAVNLELRPASQTVTVGAAVTVGLYATSDNAEDRAIGAIDAIISNTPDQLLYSSYSSAASPYSWLLSGFLTAPDGINTSLYDGDRLFTAWSGFSPNPPAVATQDGLLVATFSFTAQSAASETRIAIAPTFGQSCRTVVWDGTEPNHDITGSLGSAGIRILPTGALTTVAQAKSKADEAHIYLLGPVVTRVFDGYFYVEDRSRACAIRVNCSSAQLPFEGTSPLISGIIRTVDEERVIDQATVAAGRVEPPIRAMGMANRTAASGPLPGGLLVKLWGLATVRSPDATAFTLDDGSGNPVLVELHNASAPDDGDYVAVTGVLRIRQSGPLLLANDQTDVDTLH